MQLHLAPFTLPRYPYPGAREAAQVFLELSVTGPLGSRPAAPPLELLSLTHTERLLQDVLDRPAAVFLGLRQDRPAMACTDAPGGQSFARQRRQTEQPQRVGDGAAALADSLRHRFLVEAVVHQLLKRFGLLQRVQVLPLQVLDDRQLEG